MDQNLIIKSARNWKGVFCTDSIIWRQTIFPVIWEMKPFYEVNCYDDTDPRCANTFRLNKDIYIYILEQIIDYI